MNINIVSGRTKTLIGACQQAIAKAIGSSTLAETAQRRCRIGMEQFAAGQAQQIIKQCIARMEMH